MPYLIINSLFFIRNGANAWVNMLTNDKRKDGKLDCLQKQVRQKASEKICNTKHCGTIQNMHHH